MIYNALIPPGCSTGLIPRNYKTHPPGYQVGTTVFPTENLIDKSEWADRLNEQKKNKATLLDIREAHYDTLKSLDQDGLGLCWAFSTTKAVMYLRQLMGVTPIRLSAWYVAGVIKGWRDQGGWGAASLAQVVKGGVPAESYCPSYHSKFDTPETQANAALHEVTEWWDGVDDPDLNTKICVSMLLQTTPCVVDLNDMGHSMCCVGFEVSPFALIFDNSWGTNGDPLGLYRGTGARARPDGLVIPRVSLPTPT